MALIRRLMFVALLIAVVSWPYSGRGQTGAKNGEWRAYSAEEASTRYSPIDQITRDNVGMLEVAWTWKFDNYGSAAQTATTETTPLMIGGKLFFTAGQRRTVVAADAGTGETIWTWRPDEGARFDAAPRKVHRGVAYWSSGQDERIVVVTPGFRARVARCEDRSPGARLRRGRHRRSVQAARQRLRSRSDRPNW